MWVGVEVDCELFVVDDWFEFVFFEVFDECVELVGCFVVEVGGDVGEYVL